MTITLGVTIGCMRQTQRNKSLRLESKERARQLLAELVRDRFEGSQTKASEALGIAQSTISAIIDGKTGAGTKVLDAMSLVDPSIWPRVLGRAVPTQLDNRGLAIEVCVRDGYGTAEEAERAAGELALSADSPVEDWLAGVKVALRELRKRGGRARLQGTVETYDVETGRPGPRLKIRAGGDRTNPRPVARKHVK